MLLLLQQQLLLFAVLLPTVVAHCPIGTISRPEFGRCYKLSSYRKPFYMAEEACQAIGGHLVSVGNGFENAMLADIARSQNLKGPFFIGYNRIVSSDWSWIDGYNVSNFTKWGPEERSVRRMIKSVPIRRRSGQPYVQGEIQNLT
ncbi:hypothetical protein Y032_0378g285 [Ancylostoma ceylanicum]|uniref:C-type lectin domain-containing protein n=1 Tax=Ancylostoma ceylanicum TaxID=53326 RepID=A0A016RTI7_9BILA|nr:hypothetical protein Y032_0378g285 [Ancylostoma ceylanicum]